MVYRLLRRGLEGCSRAMNVISIHQSSYLRLSSKDQAKTLAGSHHISSTKTNTISKRTKARFHMTQIIKELYHVCSMQTVHLSCIEISTISEQTKSSLHLSLFNYEYHRMRLKWFLSLWCIRRKPCTYLLPKLTQSLNEPKQDSI